MTFKNNNMIENNVLMPFQEHDLLRTVGINTDYVLTTDFSVEEKDTCFLTEVIIHK